MGLFWRMRQRGQPDPAPAPVAEDVPSVPALVDWPRIQSRHPNWWQVSRIEQHGTERHLVLIAEVRSQDEAFRVAAQQRSQVRITKWGAGIRPYESYRAPLLVITGTVESK